MSRATQQEKRQAACVTKGHLMLSSCAMPDAVRTALMLPRNPTWQQAGCISPRCCTWYFQPAAVAPQVFLEDAGFDWKILGPDVSNEAYVAWQCDQDAYACSGQKCSAQSVLFMHSNWAQAGARLRAHTPNTPANCIWFRVATGPSSHVQHSERQLLQCVASQLCSVVRDACRAHR